MSQRTTGPHLDTARPPRARKGPPRGIAVASDVSTRKGTPDHGSPTGGTAVEATHEGASHSPPTARTTVVGAVRAPDPASRVREGAAGAAPATDSAPPARKGPPHTPPPGPALVLGGLALAGAALGAGVFAAGEMRGFLDRMAGVVALVALSIAVMLGLATALRGLLAPRVRSHAQRLHRAAGAVGVGSLLTHIGVKVAGGKVDAAAAALGWGSGDALVALGTLACHLFLLAFATGVWRGVFATRRWIRPFRILHGASYAGWATAVVHGLTAGRPPAPWVVALYAVCLAATATALLHRWIGGRR